MLYQALEKMQTWMKAMGSVCLAGMALVTCLDVAGRGLFNSPIFGSEEIVTILAVLAIAFALPSAHAERSHIGVELFMRLLSRRTRIVVRAITDTIALALFSLVTWRMWMYANTIRESGEVSMNLELPTYMVIFVLAFSFFAFVLMIARDLLTFVYTEEE